MRIGYINEHGGRVEGTGQLTGKLRVQKGTAPADLESLPSGDAAQAGAYRALSPLIHPSTQALHLLFIPLPCEVKGVWRGTLPSIIAR